MTCSSGACTCSAGTSSCVANTLVACSADGTSATRTECPAGCDATTARCKKVVPSNGLGLDYYSATLDWTATPGAVITTGDATTPPSMSGGADALIAIVAQPGGPEIAVFKFRSITIPSGVTVRVTGNRPLALLAATTVSIAGTLDVSSNYTRDCGPGANQSACSPGLRATPTSAMPTKRWGCGASGGSYATLAGSGGRALNQGCTIAYPVSNAACTNVSLVPLLGGGTGGESIDSSPEGAILLGGCGGGAVQIVAGASLSVSGVISASGGGGGYERYYPIPHVWDRNPDDYGGSGGGSGGAILLEAPVVHLAGQLFANGGGGSGGALSSATALPSPGQNGGVLTMAETAVAGSDANCGSGGPGAAASTPAGFGTSAKVDGTTGGGGGGGGAGRIRVNDGSSTLTCQATAPFFPKLVGVTTCGDVVTQ